MNITSILVVSDFSAQEGAAIQRASQLACTHGAALKLAYAPADRKPTAANASNRLANIARQLNEDLGLPVEAAPMPTNALGHIVRQARASDLLVISYRQEHPIAAFRRRQLIQQLQRRCHCPVLVTKAVPQAPYRHVLVAADLRPESKTFVTLAAQLAPSAQLEIFHAIDTRDEAKLRSAEASEQAVRNYRQRRMQQAREGVHQLTQLGAGRPVLSAIGHGDPSWQTAIHQAHRGADLVVVGTRRAPAWLDFLCGGVAHRLLGRVGSDVLIVPHDWVAGVRHTAVAATSQVSHAARPAPSLARGRP